MTRSLILRELRMLFENSHVVLRMNYDATWLFFKISNPKSQISKKFQFPIYSIPNREIVAATGQ